LDVDRLVTVIVKVKVPPTGTAVVDGTRVIRRDLRVQSPTLVPLLLVTLESDLEGGQGLVES
jgi:hypothetical protein